MGPGCVKTRKYPENGASGANFFASLSLYWRKTVENRLVFIDCRRSFERFHTAWVKVRRSGTSRSTTGAPPTTELLTDRPAQPFRANSRLVQSSNPEADNLQRHTPQAAASLWANRRHDGQNRRKVGTVTCSICAR